MKESTARAEGNRTSELEFAAPWDTTADCPQRRPEYFIPGDPLPSPVRGGPELLSEQGKKVLKQLSGPLPVRFLSELGTVWISIFAAILLAAYADHFIISILVILFISTRQNLLGLLVHEQVHYLCSRERWADAVTNLFAGWPLISLSVESYAKVHLAHHSYFFTEKDPDFFRKNGREWTFPMKVRFLCWLFFKDFFGGTFISNLKGKNRAREDFIKRLASLPHWSRVAYYLTIVLTCIALGVWKELLLYWFLPLLTVLPIIVRFGAICEHKYNVVSGRLEELTAIIILRWWEKLILPNLNFNYHLYHHFYPGVSFANLPKVHELFCHELLVDEENVFYGYGSYLKHLMKPIGSFQANETQKVE